MCVRELFVFFELWFGGLLLFALAWFLSRLCQAVTLAYGDRDLSSSSDLALCLVFGFRSPFEFSLFVSFLSLFSLVTQCVCCQCTHQGEIEDLCGSRTGGWSLLGVMSE
jgi:hypothetical protein